MIGKTLSHYRIVEKIGAGGMGEVYRARDEHLGRDVALKVLPTGTLADEHARKRFRKEAQALSKLSHPNIATVFDFDTQDGTDFLVMELVEGVTLSGRLASGSLPEKEITRLGMQLAEALEEAHERRVVHRDLKPGNVMVTAKGQVKVLDFGLAKLVQPVTGTATTESFTETQAAAGTLPYMAPEQLRGEQVDARTDIHALGAVLYEMATGQRAFSETHGARLIDAILHGTPPTPRAINPRVSSELENIILKCLDKDPAKRCQSVRELKDELNLLKGEIAPAVASAQRIIQTVRRPHVALAAGLVLVVLSLSSIWLFKHAGKIRWAKEYAIPQIIQLVDNNRYKEAFALAKEAERYIPDHPLLAKLWPEMSFVIAIRSTPEGADVYMKPYAPEEDAWELLGRTPLDQVRIPRVSLRWRVQKGGFAPIESATSSYFFLSRPFLDLGLVKAEDAPRGMVFVPGDNFSPQIPGLDHLPAVPLGDYWIDKYEVTNREFKQFLDAGGYKDPKYWKHKFTRNGHELSWAEAMAEFHDRTGRPGPVNWQLGEYPEGEEDYPVTGISWYEAAVYAEFVGKSLPTVYHWSRAAGTWATAKISPVSNLGGRSLARVGTHSGVSPYGTYDMAGNAKEWCWNPSGPRRFILGGAWNEPVYMFTDADAQRPFERSLTYGFRLVKYLSEPAKAALDPIASLLRDYSKEKPVSDETFRFYAGLYAYDKTPLNPEIESVDDSSEYWRKEKVSFDAAYGNERMIAYVFLPKKATPPYQTVVYFPGSGAIQMRSSRELQLGRLGLVIKSGRALIYPIYKSTYERGDDINSDYQNRTTFYRDHVIMWSKDLARTLDYIETRRDLEHEKVAYYGLSWGAALAPIFAAEEKRIKVVLLVAGGLMLQETLPEVDPFNFAPRMKQPTLLANGRYDYFYPIDSSQRPFFRFLGAPENEKRYVIFETGHVPPNDLLIKEILDWLDRYLGRVE